MNLRIVPAVLADVEQSIRFYRDLQPGLGTRFHEAFNATLQSIGQRPQSFPVIFDGHRRALLPSFPYAAYFKIEGDDIFIVLVIHLARRPQLTAALLRRRKNDS